MHIEEKMDLGNIGGFRVPKKALFSGFQPFFGHFKGPEWCQTKIQGHATPAERSPMIAERICGFWFQGSFVQIMAHGALYITVHGSVICSAVQSLPKCTIWRNLCRSCILHFIREIERVNKLITAFFSPPHFLRLQKEEQ